MNNISNIGYRWSFGGDKDLAEILLRLVLCGMKTATTGLYLEDEPIGKIGEYAVVYDEFTGKDLCVIQYTNVEVLPFLSVPYEYIKKEGEGDTSVESWRVSHRDFYKREYGDQFDDTSLVLCEEFRLVKNLII